MRLIQRVASSRGSRLRIATTRDRKRSASGSRALPFLCLEVRLDFVGHRRARCFNGVAKFGRCATEFLGPVAYFPIFADVDAVAITRTAIRQVISHFVFPRWY